METKKWIGFIDATEEGSQPGITIERSSTPLVAEAMRDAGQRTTMRLCYKVGGAWQGEAQIYQTVEVPGTSHMDEEGSPAVPKDGLFVALPDDAADIEVRVIDKTTHALEDEILLAPQAKHFIEEEFQEVFEPDPLVYEKDELFPGRDVDYLGNKSMEGVQVAHLIVYLGQYRPQSKRLELVQSMTLELSYSVPPAMDRSPGRKPRQAIDNDLIIGLDVLDEATDFSSKVEDFSAYEEMDVREAHARDLAQTKRGLSGLESVDEMHSEHPDDGTPTSTDPNSGGLDRPKLKIRGLICEYVIVTSSTLASAVEPLRAAKVGWPHYARVALTSDIQNEFPGRSLKRSIKSFLQWAYRNWRVPPRFVVLAADSDVIPMHFYNRGGRTYASDHYYQDIEGDLVPEITVSRLPSSNASILRQMCDYITRYASYRRGDWGGWQNRVMLCAYQSGTYETTCDQVANKIKGRYRAVKRYAKNTNKSQVTATMRDGVVFAVYRGHGSKTAWSSSNGLNSGDVRSLANYGRPPFVLSICCQNGWVDDNATETIAEAFMRHRKSVGVFASSRNSWTYPNNDFIKYMFDAVMIGRCQTPAEIIRYGKLKMVRNHPTSSYHLDNAVMYNLFGDPTADVASNAEYLRGDWDMNHDGWKGVLKVNRIWNYRIERSGSDRAPVWSISGEYKRGGASYPFSGKLGGFDANQLGSGSKRTDYRFDFKVRFSSSNNQRFLTYIHTWNPKLLSGLCWWANHPFGVQAKKR